MPGNIIKINNVSEFYVGDSKMPDLITFLKDRGFPENKEAKKLVKGEGALWISTDKGVKKVAV